MQCSITDELIGNSIQESVARDIDVRRSIPATCLKNPVDTNMTIMQVTAAGTSAHKHDASFGFETSRMIDVDRFMSSEMSMQGLESAAQRASINTDDKINWLPFKQYHN